MAALKDTVTFRITGEITIEDFARAVRRFADLVAALNRELEEGSNLDWFLADLQYGSAMATAQARPKAGQDWSDPLRQAAETLPHLYLEVGAALETNAPVPGSQKIGDCAFRVRDLTEKVEAITFETWEDDITIERIPQPQPLPERARAYAYGAVEGRVQALTNRGSLRFTLYDMLHDRAVSCYMMEGREDQMRGIWGRLAVVEGWVRRDPRSGRPLAVRNIMNITAQREPEPDIHRRARGAAPRDRDQMRAEDAIRRVRDA